jgi:hypothetical protein
LFLNTIWYLPLTLGSFTPVTTTQLTLAPGDYLLNFTSFAYNSVPQFEMVGCIIDGTFSPGDAIGIDGAINDGRALIALQKTVTVASTRVVAVTCGNGGYGPLEISLYNSIFTALKVSSIQEQATAGAKTTKVPLPKPKPKS